MGTEFKGCIPIITVRDIQSAKAFYVDVLGFAVEFEWGEPLTMVGLCKDAVEVHLFSSLHENARQPPGTANISVLTDEVDELFERCRASAAEVLIEPGARPYGLIDFAIRDPEGNVLNFGCDAAPQPD